MKKKLMFMSPYAGRLDAVVEADGAKPLTEERRKELLALAKSGELDRLLFQITAFRHQYPNRNFIRFRDQEVNKLAKTFSDQPFLRDHGGGGFFSPASQETRGGTILRGFLADEGEAKVIKEVVEAVKPWLQVGVLDGTVDRFSIGWRTEEYRCTVCEKAFNFGHDHLPGETYDGALCEIMCMGVEGVETSCVITPAVVGTKVDQIMAASEGVGFYTPLAALSYMFLDPAPGVVPGARTTKEGQMLEKLKKILRLPATATEEEAFAALEARLTQPTGAFRSTICGALGLPADAPDDQVIGKLVALTAPGVMVDRATHDQVVAQLNAVKVTQVIKDALSAGKITPATREWAEAWAKRDLTAFEAYLKHAPVQVPLQPVTAPVVQVNVEKTSISDDAKRLYAKMGLSEEEMPLAAKFPLYGEDEPIRFPRPKTAEEGR